MAHDPEYASAMAAARRLGGKNRRAARGLPPSQPAPAVDALRDLDSLLTVMAEAFADAMAQERSLSRAKTLARLVEVGMRLWEMSEVEQRLDALEACT